MREIYSKTEMMDLYTVNKKLSLGMIVYDRNDGLDWSIQQSCRLIESIILGIPIPSLYFYESREGTRHVLDGEKRLKTITRFMEDQMPLRFTDSLEEYRGRVFSELPKYIQARFEDYMTTCVVFVPPITEWDLADLYERLNANDLIFQSLRSSSVFIGKKSRECEFIVSIKQQLERRYGTLQNITPEFDELYILRSVAFLLLKQGFRWGVSVVFWGDYKRFLIDVLNVLNSQMNQDKLNELADCFLMGIKIWKQASIQDEIPFRSIYSRPKRLVVFEMQIYIAIYSVRNYLPDVDAKIRKITHMFLMESAFVNGRTDSALQVRMRSMLVDECINDNK